jgi:carboxypeptidase Q
MKRTLVGAFAALALMAPAAQAQTWAVEDPVLQRIWQLGMNESQAERLGQVLLDSIGPRLTGSPGLRRANEWAVNTFRGWGIEARNEQYGTWRGWDRGITQVELVQPRVRSLEGMMLAWSPGTRRPVQAPVVVVPEYSTEAELDAWVRTVRGRIVALSFPQPTCRPDTHYREFGAPGALDRLQESRRAAQDAYRQRVASAPLLRLRLEEAGAVGILESNWSGDIGVNKIFGTNTRRIPTIDLSCEDYGLVHRLAANGQGPVVRIHAESRELGEVPVHNTIAEIRGRELPNEYVMLSAHFDSWDGASGATDNGTGSIVMMEAMRILQQVYPNPRRTILLGLWGGEEQGLNGSRRFVGMHPEVVEGLQALFNQDNGTGRVINISAQGLVGAGGHLGRWLAQVPSEITGHIRYDFPGVPGGGGTDHAAFICAGAPGFNLSSHPWSYFMHTWHTNRDTYDKIVFEEIRNNAVLTAMLVYLASEDPDRMPRDRRVMPLNREGQPTQWPACQPGRASSN